MDSDYGSSSSSEPDNEPSAGLVDEWNTIISSETRAVPSGPRFNSDDSKDSPRSSTPEQKPPKLVTMTARAYQIEMLEESLKQNIIVAMDTGSGKTQVAVLRIKAELERSEKRVWFLAPTVSLAEQQFKVIQAQIPDVQSKFICGADNVQAWASKPGVWDEILLNIRVVVSTERILFDAVSHAFVPLNSLSLIVIDEGVQLCFISFELRPLISRVAHNCVKMNPVARLMNEHYSVAKAGGQPVPHILGLTASPLMRSNLDDLERLEQTLDAVCKTPSKHRDELLAQVKRPDMILVSYGSLPYEDAGDPTPTMSRLSSVYRGLDIKTDPLILKLLTENSPRDRELLLKAVRTRNTYCQRQMKSFCVRARDTCIHIGPWAADYYIYKVISEFLSTLDTPDWQTSDLTGQEKIYLANAFRMVDSMPPSDTPAPLSAKVNKLIDILERYQGNPMGIVFVKERATVAVLSHILSIHPRIKPRYRVGSVVGTSKIPGKRKDFLDQSKKDDRLSLEGFRKGISNLLVATSVLEEGIDVPACNLVICFDKPSNLKSFIQRRGRARMSASQLYLLVEDASDPSTMDWESLERAMKQKYESEMREHEALKAIEDSEAMDYPVLRNEETGAQLTIHDAKQHLEHFCATLSKRKFVDWSPFYTIQDLEGNPVDTYQQTLRKATVHLPVSLAPRLRRFESLHAWPSEANACKDAAFQAYAKLYEVGLVNRHLLPIRESGLLEEVEPRLGMAEVKEQFNPWPRVAQAWRDDAAISRRRITISSHDGSARAAFELVLPVPVPEMEQLELYWDHKSSWLVDMKSDLCDTEARAAVDSQTDHTSVLIAMAFGHRWRGGEKQHPVRFVSLDRDVRIEDMGVDRISADTVVTSTHLVRDIANQSHPHFYLEWLRHKPPAELVRKPYTGFDEAPRDVPYVAVRSWPKKAGFFRPLHANAAPMPSSKPYPRVVPAEQIRVDRLPAMFAHVGMLIPAITHALEVHLVARELLETSLEKTGITDLSLVVEAISASAARGPTDYERIEFVGDSILKFCTTINGLAKNLLWTEGELSRFKDGIIANSRLCDAAINFGLDGYIIHRAFTLHKWRPTYVEDLLANPPPTNATRFLSTKTLADVVEALIGASYQSGDIPKALDCLSLFLPQVGWESAEHCRRVLYDEAPHDEPLPVPMRQLEQLIGYNFTKKSLLVEAMTHPSYNRLLVRASLDRLEFLGDAILDYVVVRKLFFREDRLDNSTLHLMKTALVNADVLGFLVMEWHVTQERMEVTGGGAIGGDEEEDEVSGPEDTMAEDAKPADETEELRLVKSEVSLPLWSFMRHGSADMGTIQQATKRRHAAMREEILEALWHGGAYPWALFARLQAQKFYSDLFESLLGAVWVDSGSIEACEEVVERAGILPLMERLLKDKVHLLHPKEELGRLAVSETTDYEVEVKEREGAEKEFRCRVLVGGECLARVEGCVSREHARIRAAEEACRVLKGRMRGDDELEM
ncbi:Dicer-like protein 2 [Madurella mycetomatis]|uniref:Dicer-like protein 2 n=1 Tax=Madurella mycetomatis TaxID=100816 RepID=A0A175W9K9_9PEZI|nr:Dicer-like protein 2 [Madurella mycetomatis]